MNAALAISSPEHLRGEHELDDFDCGVQSLNEWLKRRSLANEASGASRTYVVAVGRRVVGYYALATGAVSREVATGAVSRQMPEPVPVMVLGRLAVDREFQNAGVGAGLLKDAVLRTLSVAEVAGIRAMLLHALSEDAKRFYARFGFAESSVEPMTMMATLTEIERNLR